MYGGEMTRGSIFLYVRRGLFSIYGRLTDFLFYRPELLDRFLFIIQLEDQMMAGITQKFTIKPEQKAKITLYW